MDGEYDEIMSDNPFFVEFKKEFNSLFQHCISQSWIICVPRIGSLNARAFTIDDFCAHVLVPSDELPETHYNTLTEKLVIVTNKVITIEVVQGLPLQSHILFEETFYTEDFIKYKVWCIETPLEHSTVKDDSTNIKDQLTSVNDCINLLWTQAAGRHTLEQIEQTVQLFLRKKTMLPIAIGPLRDATCELYTQCLQIALQNRRLREKSKTNKQVLDNIKVAVETYMQHLLFQSIFKPICTSCAYEDAHLNKKIRNMCDIQLRDLDIKKELYHAVPRAKQILSKIDSYSTVLEKSLCLKQALNAICKRDSSNNIVLLTADDMLPVFVFLIIKSGLPNWYSQLIYMKEFHFSSIGKGDADEFAFLITTLEAVIEHIQSGALTGSPDPESYYCESNLTEENMKKRKVSLTESVSTSETNVCNENLDYIFDLIKANHEEQVRTILARNQKHLDSIKENDNNILCIDLDENSDTDDSDSEIYQKLCHPLCNCKKCRCRISKNLLKSSPTVISRDSHGLTPLHVASIHGKATIVECLIEMGANINATDLNECTPLHYAASRGHQNALLLLLHTGADINKPNIDKNSPLHLAVNNGHLNCVKALIYFAEHSRNKIKINPRNESGNTPLHLASKWGYEGIARLLIENGAEPSLQNHSGRTAFDYAHNLKIMQVLKSCSPNLYEYIHITSSEVKVINCKIDNPITAKLQAMQIKQNDNASITLENLKIIERVIKAIFYGDVKLACFYMDIDYSSFTGTDEKMNGNVCHPLCECKNCKKHIESPKTDFDVNFTDTNGFTALHYAAQYGSDEMCKILLMKRANVNNRNKKGETPLHLASLHNKTVVIRLLLDNGANIDAIDNNGNTALHQASHMGNIGAVKIIIGYKPNIIILNASEKTALDIARDKVHLTIIDIIEKYSNRKFL